MATLRHTAGFKSTEGVEFDIYIDDTAYASTENPFKVTAEGFRLTYEGEGGERHQPIIASSVTFNMIVANGTDENLITALIGAEEGRFKVKILKSGLLYWVGFILTDIISVEDQYFPYIFEIRATDGIGRLKNIDYNDSGVSYEGRETLLQHMINCFSKLDFDYFHGSTSFLETADNWYELQHTVVAGLDPLTVTDLDHRVFIDVDGNNKIRYKSCYDVLENIAIMRRARIYFSDGTWRFEQPSIRTGSFPEWRYQSNGTFISYSSTSYDKTINQTLSGARLASGNYDWFAPLNKVCINYKHKDDENLVQPFEFSSAEVATTINVGDVVVIPAESLFKFFGNLQIGVTWLNFNQSQMFRMVYKFTIKCGTRYLTRQSYVIGGTGIQYTAPQWTLSAQYWEFSTGFYELTNPLNPGLEDVFDVSFTTPLLGGLSSENPRNVTFRFEYLETRTFFNTIIYPGSLFSHTYILADANMQYLGDGSLVTTNSGIEYCVTNALATTNTEEIKLETLFGDGPTISSYSALKVYTGAAWATSNDWRINDAGTAYSLQELVISDTLAGQKLPVRKYQGTMYGSIVAQHKLIDGAFEYILLGGTFEAGLDKFSGTWYVIDTDYSNITIEAEIILNELPTLPGPGVVGGGGGGKSNHTELVMAALLNAVANTVLLADVPPGFVESVPIAPTLGTLYQSGDQITIINPITGYSQDFIVQLDMEVGDTEIVINDTIEFGFPPGSQIIATGSQSGPDYELSSEIVTSFFEDGATIEDTDYYLETTAKVPTIEYFGILGTTTSWTVTTPTNFYTVPPLFNGGTFTSYIAAKTAGTGSGNNTLLIKKNGTTAVTHSMAAAVKTSTGTTTVTMATGDEITFDITAITGTTAASGLTVYLTVTPELNVEFQKIKYTLNRVITEDLVLFYKMNQIPYVPIGLGSVRFDTTQRIDMGTPANLNIIANHTIMGWARYETFSTENAIIGKHDGVSGFLLYNKASVLIFLVNLTNTCQISATGNIALYKWYHYAATLSGTTAKIYLDGKLMSTQTYAVPVTNSASFAVGAYDTNQGGFDGNVTKTGIWSIALTDDQINSVMNKRYSDFTEAEKVSLISWWDLDDITDVTDKHSGNDGTVTTI